jgi:2',3'-cyclic-nucleotide 2'-phosphodiesterase/3'-nucleotidase/5'-nucleotidase
MKLFGTALAAAAIAGASTLVAGGPAAPPPTLTLTTIGTVKTGLIRAEDPRVAEINAFDPIGRRVYVVNPREGRIDVIDATDPLSPVAAAPVDIVAACTAALGEQCPVLPGSEPNSVAIANGAMAVAVAHATRTANGHVVFFKLRGDEPAEFMVALEVGALPDMVTFSSDGALVLVANEGEPDQSYTIDPPGSVSIIDVRNLRKPGSVRQVDFSSFDAPAARAALEAAGVRVFGPGAPPSRDLEPEYIAIAGTKAYVTLQEANGLAIIDIPTATVDRIVGLGRKDHMLAGQGLDPSDQDGGVRIANWPVSGLYQSDAIAAFEWGKRTYLITANEGDAREYAGYTEPLRLGNARYVLDPIAFPNASALKASAALGRLNVTTASGDIDGDGDFDRIDVFGGRSVSIRDADGQLVWDSGDLFERLSETLNGTQAIFNTTNTANSLDNRSDDKGVEPESVVIGDVNGRRYAFVGLERDSGIVVLELSNPAAPRLVNYVSNRKFPRNPTTGVLLACNDTNDCGDLGPEGLTFVPAKRSPTGKALLIVSNEVSSTTTIWQIE